MTTALVKSFFAQLDPDDEHDRQGHSEIIDYLASFLNETIPEPCEGEGDVGIDEFVAMFTDTVAGFFPELEDHEDLHSTASTLVKKIKKRKFMMSSKAVFHVSEEQKTPSHDAVHSIKQIVDESLRETAKAPSETQILPSIPPAAEPLNPMVEQLQALLPESSTLEPKHVDFLCSGFGHDFEHAAHHLLDTFVGPSPEDVQKNEQALISKFEEWESDRLAEQSRDAEAAENHRQAVLDKYFMQADDAKKTHRPVVFVKESRSTSASGSHFRYLDGQRVAMKNKKDKFIIETAPVWDGGSRGRVKTKRKGGVGWV